LNRTSAVYSAISRAYILTIWSFYEAPMKSIPVVEAKARFSALLAEVEAGEEIAVTRHGKVIARLVPDHSRKAADVFRDFWADADEIDLVAPDDKLAEGVASLDD
jgi:prevent-host-death family protein